MRRRVVFPAPFGPARASRSRRSTLKLTPSKRRLPASSLRRFVAMTTAMRPSVESPAKVGSARRRRRLLAAPPATLRSDLRRRLVERLREVRHQVGRALDAAAHPNEIVGDADPFPLFRSHAGM